MDRWRQALLIGRLVVWCALFWIILEGLPHIANWNRRTAPAPAPPESFSISLTVTPATIAPGQSATLCYQALRATTFFLEPSPPGFPAGARACLAVSPPETTRYTFTATDALQNRLTKTVRLTVTR